ncbi:MAG: class IV adenylate cyclase [Nanoarchaeota archaeon]|nr:class IV adenylate cyclase [Nanoarchaeota archaeon]
MIEFEIKLLEIDEDKIIQKLISIGAKKVFDGDLISIYFDDKAEVFFDKGNVLRLRKKKDRTELTVKTPIDFDGIKRMDEYQTEVSDIDETKKILNALGYIERLIYKKHRKSFVLDSIHFEIDKYQDIPVFLEIEAQIEDELKKACLLLELEFNDSKPWTAKEVLEFYKK